jgi:hypothetical protein
MPQHPALQRYKMTHHGTEKKRPGALVSRDRARPIFGLGTPDIDDAQDVRRPVMVELHPATHWFTSGAGSSRRVSAMTGIVRLVFCWYPANPG